MKLRLKALLLAAGLTVSSLSVPVFAEEADDSEQISEISEAESASDEEAEIVIEETDEAGSGAEEADDADTSGEETAEDADEDAEITDEDYYIYLLDYYLSLISGWTDDEIDIYMDSDDPLTALVALNWNTVKSEVGNYEDMVEITGEEITDNGYAGSFTGIAEYDGISTGGTVYVTMSYEYVYSSTYGQYLMTLSNIEWSVDYTLGAMMQKAALNTVMGICIVFLGLLFLSFLIRAIRLIPKLTDRISGKNKKEPETVTEEAVPAVPEAEEPEEEISPEDELIAVIAAAVAAASSDKSAVSTGDAYVVRSIKKINNRNWRRA